MMPHGCCKHNLACLTRIVFCVRRLNNPSATLFGFVGENKTQTSYILTLASPKINDDDEVRLRLFEWY